MGEARRGRPGIGSAVVMITMLLGVACAAPEPAQPPPAPPPPSEAGPTRTGTPELAVEELITGSDHVWDIGVLPDGRALITERDGRIGLLSSVTPGATLTAVDADLSDVYVRGEGGHMGLAPHPDFAESRRFTTCQTHQTGGQPTDVRLVTWQLSADGTTAARVADPLVGGLPINQSGRHSGCRPTFAPDGTLFVGTGDTARAAVAQDLHSLGGKVLRIDPETGEAPEDLPTPNPFAEADNPAQRLIWTFGHRNVQGVAIRPGTDEVYTTEHGPDRDDEVNRLVAGGNYGWDPSQGGVVGGYDENVPMTDLARFPDAVAALWSSGDPVEAISGAAFLSGGMWGDLDGALAVAALRGEKLLIMRFGPDGAVTQVDVPPPLNGTYGRLRAVRLAPDGALLVSTSNGGNDKILRITPG